MHWGILGFVFVVSVGVGVIVAALRQQRGAPKPPDHLN